MFALTDTATTVVKELVTGAGAPEGSGLRIEAEDTDATQFGVAIAPAPEQGDAVVEQSGARVYLGERATIALDDKVLDARVAEDGRVSFDILPQQV
ncbi:iron-sulfur cluster assembly accessory protein [Agromyces sp. SYSU T0242]|uniref:iron-sulfur cluster assembly accessory protein n=1 Tax=Agromyces litoreus TaxID=3158561 RepID=UPI0033920B01